MPDAQLASPRGWVGSPRNPVVVAGSPAWLLGTDLALGLHVNIVEGGAIAYTFPEIDGAMPRSEMRPQPDLSRLCAASSSPGTSW